MTPITVSAPASRVRHCWRQLSRSLSPHSEGEVQATGVSTLLVGCRGSTVPAGPSLVGSTGEVEGDIDDHILLATDESAPAGFEKDGPGVDAVLPCCRFGVAQETGVDARIAEGECLPVDAYGSILQRADEVVGGVLEAEQVAAVLPALERGDGDERLDRAVSRPGAVPGQ